MSCKVENISTKDGRDSVLFRQISSMYGADFAIRAFIYANQKDWSGFDDIMDNGEPSLSIVLAEMNREEITPISFYSRLFRLSKKNGSPITYTENTANRLKKELDDFFGSRGISIDSFIKKNEKGNYEVGLVENATKAEIQEEREESYMPYIDADDDLVARSSNIRSSKDARKTEKAFKLLDQKIIAEYETGRDADFDDKSMMKMGADNQRMNVGTKASVKQDKYGHRFQALIEINRIKFRNIQQQMEQTELAMENARSQKNLVELKKQTAILNSLGMRATEIADTLERIYPMKNLADVVELGVADLDNVSSIANNDKSSIAELNFSKEVVDFWIRVGDWSDFDNNPIFEPHEMTSETMQEKMQAIASRAEIIKSKIVAQMRLELKSFLDEQTNQNVNLADALKLAKDIGFTHANLMDISRVDNVIFQAIYKSTKEASNRAHDEWMRLSTRIDKMIPQVIDELRKINSSNPFDIFRQKDSRGRLTQGMIGKISVEFFRAKQKNYFDKIYSKEKKSAQTYKDANRWLKENEIMLDARLFFPMEGYTSANRKFKISDETIALHKKEIIDQVGQEQFDKMYAELERKISQYNFDLQAISDEINSSELTQKEKEQEIKRWVIQNSPYIAAELYFNPNEFLKKTNRYTVDGKRIANRPTFAVSFPRKTKSNGESTGWYDKEFERIEQSPVLMEFYNLWIDSMSKLNVIIPKYKKDLLKDNAIPEIEKSLLEIYAEKGFKGFFAGLNQSIHEAIRTSETEAVDAALRNPGTGNQIRQVQANFIRSSKQRIKDLVAKAKAEYMLAEKKYPSKNEIREMRFDAINEAMQNNSSDLFKILKAYSALALSYKYKAKIQDQIHLAYSMFETTKESASNAHGQEVTDIYGNKVESSGNLDNLRSMLKFFMDNFDNYKTIDEGKASTSDWNTKSEKSEKKEIATLNDAIEGIAHENTKIKFDQEQEVRKELESAEKNIGGKANFTKVGDSLLIWTAIKGLGWNIPSAIVNFMVGTVSNLVQSAGNRFFSTGQLMRAYWLTRKSVLRNFKENEEGQKIRALMEKFKVLQVSSNDYFNATQESWIGRKLKNLSPFEFQNKTEYLNQAPIMIAMLLNTTIKDKNGVESTLYSAFDNEGNLKEEFRIEENLTNWTTELSDDGGKFKYALQAKISQVIKSTHGNYDLDSPIRVRKTLIGRALNQFRRWLAEGVASRFEASKYDHILEMQRKGRYRSITSVEKTDGTMYSMGQSIAIQMKEILRRFTFGKVDLNKGLDAMEVDIENFRKNSFELATILSIMAMTIMLRIAFGGETDDEEDDFSAMGNLLVNSMVRTQTDLMFYANPFSVESFTKNIIPAAKTVAETKDLMNAGIKFIFGEDELKSGVNAGSSRLFKETLDYFPVLNTYNRTASAFQKIYDDNKSPLTSIEKEFVSFINDEE